MNKQFRIEHVAAVGPSRLALVFGDGHAAEVDLADLIAKHPTLARLRDSQLFTQVEPDEWNLGVIFAGDDDLTLASDNLRALSFEQAGEYSHQPLVTWMHRHGLTLDTGAAALGLSRRMLAYYRSGEKPIPRTVGLAMAGWEEAQASAMHSKHAGADDLKRVPMSAAVKAQIEEVAKALGYASVRFMTSAEDAALERTFVTTVAKMLDRGCFVPESADVTTAGQAQRRQKVRTE